MSISDTALASDIEVLNQLIDEDFGVYRIRAKHRVLYVSISATVFDEQTMCRPYLLVPKLPEFPNSDWTSMQISRRPDGTLESTLSSERLSSIQNIWHPERVDILTLPRLKSYKSGVYEVLFRGRPVIAKFACFEWDIERINNETWAYSAIEHYQQLYPSTPRIAPNFLAHLTENGRVMGLLLEKLEGNYASIDDLTRCEAVLRQLHGMSLIHGDVNRFNFLVDGIKDCVHLLDFEHVRDFDENNAHLEIESLSTELCEDTGRGKGHGYEKPQLPANFAELDTVGQKAARALHTAQSIFTVYQMLVQKEAPELLRTLRCRETSQFELMVLIGSTFDNGEPYVQSLLSQAAAPETWEKLISISYGKDAKIMCPPSYHEDELDKQQSELAKWERDLERKARVLDEVSA
ncbi:MAG: hypothetical protein M1820_006135 [Bogoriella megaspora]|nr:MAG: hypothetical protein M1820_006135 [Bogoriella megaspora]